MPEKPEPIRLPNGQVAAPEDLAPVFCDELVRQELDDDTAYVDIPEPVLEMYRIYRPSPLCRAYNLEKALGTVSYTHLVHRLREGARGAAFRARPGNLGRAPPFELASNRLAS